MAGMCSGQFTLKSVFAATALFAVYCAMVRDIMTSSGPFMAVLFTILGLAAIALAVVSVLLGPRSAWVVIGIGWYLILMGLVFYIATIPPHLHAH